MSAVPADKIDNPFAGAPVVAAPNSASAAALVQREVAEVQAAMVIAKRFPRDAVAAMDRILMACARPSLAEDATYVYARGGQEVTGASIRLAEQLARDWGNLQCGVMEISRANGVSECLAYAWDLETNFKDEKRFQVRHWRDTKGGGYAVKDERDIYELVANMGARRKRACILACIPGDVQESALKQCELTLRTKIEVTPERVAAMIEGFVPYGVTKEMIEKKIQRRVDAIQPAQMAQLRKIFTSLKDGMGKASDYFEVVDPAQPQPPASQTEAAKDKLRNKQTAAKPAEKPASENDNVPMYSEATAIQALKEAGSNADLEKAWVSIVADFKARGAEIPLSVDATHHDRKEALAKF